MLIRLPLRPKKRKLKRLRHRRRRPAKRVPREKMVVKAALKRKSL